MIVSITGPPLKACNPWLSAGLWCTNGKNQFQSLSDDSSRLRMARLLHQIYIGNLSRPWSSWPFQDRGLAERFVLDFRLGWRPIWLWLTDAPTQLLLLYFFGCIHSIIRSMSLPGWHSSVRTQTAKFAERRHKSTTQIVLQFIFYEGTPIKYKLASIQIGRVGLKSGR